MGFLRILFFSRKYLGRYYVLRHLKNRDFTIISDNCWGTDFYSFLEIEKRSPTIGLGIKGSHYLNFIENLHKADAFEVTEIGSEYCDLRSPEVNDYYPVARSPYAQIDFLHFPNFAVGARMFRMGFRKINWEHIYYKIDFDFYNSYTAEDIERWNKLQLPNSIAFYSDDTRKFYTGKIYHGVYFKEKKRPHNNFQALYTLNRFNFIEWINTGKITCDRTYQIIWFLMLNVRIESFVFQRINKIKKKMFG